MNNYDFIRWYLEYKKEKERIVLEEFYDYELEDIIQAIKDEFHKTINY